MERGDQKVKAEERGKERRRRTGRELEDRRRMERRNEIGGREGRVAKTEVGRRVEW